MAMAGANQAYLERLKTSLEEALGQNGISAARIGELERERAGLYHEQRFF